MQHACRHTMINKLLSVSLSEVTQTGQDLSRLDRAVLFSLPELQLMALKGLLHFNQVDYRRTCQQTPTKTRIKIFHILLCDAVG